MKKIDMNMIVSCMGHEQLQSIPDLEQGTRSHMSAEVSHRNAQLVQFLGALRWRAQPKVG